MRPMYCGDQIYISLSGSIQLESTFTLKYEVYKNDLETDKPIATASTRHVAIDPVTRRRSEIPPELLQWLAMK